MLASATRCTSAPTAAVCNSSAQARWFVKHKLGMLRELCDEHPGYGLLLVGHSLGAGAQREGWQV